MNKIEFVWVDIKDFMSVEESRLTFKSGTWLLLGKNLDSIAADDNGAGKSSIAEALRWCLYGETVRSAIDKSLPVDHVIREGTKKANVTVEFMCLGRPVIVQRTRSKIKGELTVQIGTSIVHRGAVATQALEEILGINVQQFANLVHLDGSYPYLFAPASDSDRKDILADLVDVAITTLMQREVKTRLAPVEEELDALRVAYVEESAFVTFNEGRLPKLRERGKEANDLLRAEKVKLKAAKEDLDNLITEEQLLEEENVERRAKYMTEIGEKKTRVRELEDAIKAKWEEKNNVFATYLQSDIQTVTKRLYSTQSQLKSMIARETEIKELQAQGKCPTCSQDTTEVRTEELESLTSQTERLKDEIRTDKETLDSFNEERESKLGRLRATVADFERARECHQGELEELQKADEAHRSGVLGELEDTRKRLKEHERAVLTYESIIKTQRSLRESAKYDFEHTKLEADKRKTHLIELQEDEEKLQAELEKLVFWKTGFGPKGVASLYIETVLPHISSRIQKYANILTGGDIVVSLQAYKETKSKTIREAIQISAINSKGASVYGSNSTGERNRINLAVTLGLIEYFRDMRVFSSNLLICDEIFDGLDSTGVEQALQALAEADMESALVVSHHEHLKPLFAETIYARKKNGVTEIIQ